MPDLQVFTASRSLVLGANSAKPDTVTLVYAKFSRSRTAVERRRIESWLRTRIKSKQIKLLIE